MKSLSNTMEKVLELEGFGSVAGIDEVGRGCWAGPIVAAAVIMPIDSQLEYIRDSKSLSEKRRDEMSEQIHTTAVSVGIGAVPAQEIDQIGISAANRLAMARAIEELLITPDYLLIDAFKLPEMDIPQQSIIKGDQKAYSIAAASIVAKVYRDNLMKQFDEIFPEYQFAQHKGYGTAIHREALEQYGMIELHRRSFQPMKSMV